MSEPTSINARWLIPVSAPPMAHATVRTAAGRITAIAASEPNSPRDRHYEHRLLLPGLINAHTHLEFSHLPTPLGSPNMPFPSWIEQVIRQRIEESRQPDFESKRRGSIRMGLDESSRFGIAAVGEISSAPWPEDVYTNESGPVVVPFLEQLGSLISQAKERLDQLQQACDRYRSFPRLGLSPHAPYSLSSELFLGILELAKVGRARGPVPVAMHLAESREELEYAQSGTGLFAELFARLGIEVTPDSQLSIDFCLQQLIASQPALIIHGNYLTAEQIVKLGGATKSVSVVYCPRTHQYFGHREYPLESLLNAGIPVSLGTDSRASNPDLDLLQEMRLVHARFPQIPAETIVAMGTIAGAKALGIDDRLGSLDVGKNAKILSVEFERPITGDPLEWLLREPIRRREWK